MNKEDALQKAKRLTKELELLNEIINRKIDLFSIKTYPEVCRELGEEVLNIVDFNYLPKEQQQKALAFHQIQSIQKLYNGDWKIDWKDRNQQKWYPYYTTDSHGGLVFGSSTCSGYDFIGRVEFYRDKNTSDYIGKTFLDIYKQLL